MDKQCLDAWNITMQNTELNSRSLVIRIHLGRCYRDTILGLVCMIFKEAYMYHSRPSQYILWESKN